MNEVVEHINDMSMDIVGIYVAVAIVLMFLTYLLRVVTDIRTEVRLTNGRITRIEEWKTGFTQLSQERHENRQKDLDRQERRMDKIEEDVEKEKK